MIKRKPLFGLVALAGVALSTGVAYAAVSMTSHSAQASPEAAVDLANIEANPAAAVYLQADLTGQGEMLKSGHNAGDPNGKAVVILRISRNQIMYEITWQGMASMSTVRLQQGGAGRSGPIDMNLMPNAMPTSINSVLGVISIRTGGLVSSLLGNPGGFFANLTTPGHVNGAVRGQFRRIGAFDFNRILHVGTLISVDSGDQEIQQVGNLNAHATVFVSAMGTTINYAAMWTGLTSPTALSINNGAIGAIGNTAATLFNAPQGLNPTIIAVAGMVTNVPIRSVTAIAAAPAAFHTNLATRGFPGGAVRGQLFVPGMAMTTTTMPTTTTTMPTTTTTRPTMTNPTTTMQTTPTNPTTTMPMSTATMAPTTGPVMHW